MSNALCKETYPSIDLKRKKKHTKKKYMRNAMNLNGGSIVMGAPIGIRKIRQQYCYH